MTAPRALALALPAALLVAGAAGAQETAKACAPDLEAVSAWNGVWIAEGLMADINGRPAPGDPPEIVSMKLIGLDAPWNDEGWSKLETALGPTKLNAGWGFPLMMSAPSPFKVIVAPHETTIISQYREVRYIYTDGRPQPLEEERWPTLWGHSVGCWDGDTLTVETVGIKYTPEFAYISPPLSEQARVVERLRMTAPDRIEADFTITDPQRLERPWDVHMVYLRHPGLDRLIHEGDVFDNDRFMVGEDGLTIAPPDERPAAPEPARPTVALSAAELDRLAGKYSLEGGPLEFTFERRGSRLLYRIDPVQPFFMPLTATDGLNFTGRLMPWSFRFTTDGSGQPTGFAGASPDGTPLTAKRKSG